MRKLIKKNIYKKSIAILLIIFSILYILQIKILAVEEVDGEADSEYFVEEDIEEDVEDNEVYVTENNSDTTSQYLRATSAYSSTKGYFYIQISDGEKTSKIKISVTLSSTNRSAQQTVKFSSSVVSGSNYFDFSLKTTSAKTQISDVNYDILVLQFTYTKPAHYIAKGSITRLTGYRFLYKPYPDTTGANTINTKGHSTTDVTETVDVQINVANCGIALSSTSDSMNGIGYINLSKEYYSSLSINPNGGTHNGNTSTYTYGTKCCETKTQAIEDPIREGYIFTGWTLTKGSNCSGASFNSETNIFTYCGASSSSSSVSSANTCVLKANWTKAYYDLPDAGGFPLDSIFIISGIIIVILICYKKINKRRIKK